MLNDDQGEFTKRNERNNLMGTIDCPICSEKFNFETNVNSTEVVTKVTPINYLGTNRHNSTSDNYITIISEIVSQCPKCKYKFKHYIKEKR